MSLNLYCKILTPGVMEEFRLLQTPTKVTLDICREQTWQKMLQAYLDWVKENCSGMYPSERKRVGRMWRLTESLQGRLLITPG